MKKLLFLFLLFQTNVSFGQDVNIEIADYHRKIDDKVYATYQLVNSSYSFSRSTIVFLTNKSTLFELSEELKKRMTQKQEFTDIWILGIENFDIEKITDTDQKIIDIFLQNIIKYRKDNNLPAYTFEKLFADKIYIERSDEICKYIICKKKK
jgi:hypothetical protein